MATAPPNAELIYTQPSDNILDLAKGILERYQIFLEDNSLSEMINVLGTVDSVANATINAGNIKLEITTDSYGTSFYWKHVYNNCEYNEVNVVFQQTSRIIFADMQSRYKMGSTKIEITNEQALETAIKYVENYSYEAIRGTGENETKITVSDFKISRERTTVELYPAERGGLLYPCWRVSVALASAYPGNVCGFAVDIWADSGEVLYLGTLAVGGDPTGTLPVDGSTINPSPQENNNAFSIDMVIGIAAVTIVVLSVVAATLLALKKRRSK
jgi:hypothetical protein